MRVRIKGIWYDAESTPILIQPNENDRLNIKDMPDNHQSYLTFPEHMDLYDALTELGLEINDGKMAETQIDETSRDGSIAIGKEVYKRSELEDLASEIYKITGPGPIMQAINKFLGNQGN